MSKTVAGGVPYRAVWANETGVWKIEFADGKYLVGCSMRLGEAIADLTWEAENGLTPPGTAESLDSGVARVMILHKPHRKDGETDSEFWTRVSFLRHRELREWCFMDDECLNDCDGAEDFLHSKEPDSRWQSRPNQSAAMRRKWQDPQFREEGLARLEKARNSSTKESSRQKMSQAKRGANNLYSRKCWTEMKLVEGKIIRTEFESVGLAAEHWGVSQQLMDSWIRGKIPWPGTGKRVRKPHLVGLTGGYLEL